MTDKITDDLSPPTNVKKYPCPRYRTEEEVIQYVRNMYTKAKKEVVKALDDDLEEALMFFTSYFKKEPSRQKEVKEFIHERIGTTMLSILPDNVVNRIYTEYR